MKRLFVRVPPGPWAQVIGGVFSEEESILVAIRLFAGTPYADLIRNAKEIHFKFESEPGKKSR